MPFKVECKDPPWDGYGFYLEANTKKKYKIVSTTGCPGDTTKFTKACQKMVELAKIDKEINLVRKGGDLIIQDVELPDVKQK